MAINVNILNPRIADRRLFLAAAIGFPLLVLIGYARTYYLGPFFNAQPLATSIIHIHAAVMTLWVVYFTFQTWLIRSKNIKLHMTLGWAGVGLAVLVMLVGMAAAYDAHIIRRVGVAGFPWNKFLIVPVGDLVTFAIFFAGAIYYRKKPAEHKSLMLMTALVFLPAALARIPVLGEQGGIVFSYGTAEFLGLAALVWHSIKHRKINKVFAGSLMLLAVSHWGRLWVADTQAWLAFADWVASF